MNVINPNALRVFVISPHRWFANAPGISSTEERSTRTHNRDHEQNERSEITDAARNALMAELIEVQRKMVEELTKGLQTDPASLNKNQDDFGCGLLQLYPSSGGVVEGTFGCGKNFNDGVLKVTGTMTQLR